MSTILFAMIVDCGGWLSEDGGLLFCDIFIISEAFVVSTNISANVWQVPS